MAIKPFKPLCYIIIIGINKRNKTPVPLDGAKPCTPQDPWLNLGVLRNGFVRPGGVDQSRHQGRPGDSRARDHEQRPFISYTQWLQYVDVEHSWGTPRRPGHLYVSGQHGSYEESGTRKTYPWRIASIR